MDNKALYLQALSLRLVSSPTEFWTKVRRSGLTPGAWISMATTQSCQRFEFDAVSDAEAAASDRFDFDTRSRY